MEEWRKVVGYRRLEVSDEGNARSVWPHKTVSLKPIENRDGYLRISATKEDTGKQKPVLLHRLVAEMFVDKPSSDSGLEVNHIDGKKTNNQKGNLEWVTRSENLKHAFKLGLKKATMVANVDKSKPVLVRNNETGDSFSEKSITAAAAKVGMKTGTLQRRLQKSCSTVVGNLTIEISGSK